MPHRSPRRSRGTTALAAVVALVAAPLTVLATTAPAHAADPVTVNLLNINDYHGRIAGESSSVSGGVTSYAGTVTFAATIERLRAAAGPASTLLLSAGDNIGASLYASSSQQDQPTIDVLNTLGLKTSAVGNHEFDKGFADLTGRVEPEADFSYLGANVYDKGTTTPALQEYDTFEVNGVTVGVIGAVTQETPTLVSPSGVEDLTFGDPVAAVNRVAAQLSDGNPANGEADVLVAEYHEGAGGDATTGVGTIDQEIARGGAFARIATQTAASVDAIFTGHTHKEYAFDGPVPGSTATRPIVQTGSYGDNVGQIQLTVDRDDMSVTGYTRGNTRRISNTPPADLIAQYPVLSQVKTTVDAAVARAREIGSVPVGSTAAAITRAQAGTNLDDRASESTLGNLVGNALRDTLAPARLGGAEIGVVNPGGLRADLDAGTVTAEEANNVLPFANNLNTTTLTGAQFKALLEQQWQRNADGSVPTRSYLQLGLSDNVSYTYDAALPEGSRITSITVDGAPIVPTRGYRIGTFSFLQQGGDNFRVFTQGTNPQDSGLVDFDGWVDYLGDNAGVAPSFARRAVAATDLPGTVQAGQAATVSLSRLDLTSAGSVTNTAVTAQLVRGTTTTDLGSTPVTAGAATVSATVPAGTPAGAATLVLTAAPSGTVVRLPLAVTAVPVPEKATPTVKATGSSVVFGKAPTVKVTVTSDPQATGKVNVTRRGSLLGSGTLKDGAATITLRRSVLEPGTTPVSVTYLGDENTKRTSTKTTITVRKAGALVDARVTTSPVVVGRSRARVVAVVESRTGVSARGTVRVRLGGRTVGTAKVGANGKAVIRLDAFTSAGTKKLSVKYLGSSTVRAKTDTVRVSVRRR